MDLEDIIKKLEGNAAVVERLYAGISQAEARWKPEKGRWNHLEILGHFFDIEKYDFKIELESVIHDPERSWPHFDIFNWIEEHHYNQVEIMQAVDKFIKEREKSVKWLHMLSDLKKIDPAAMHSGNGFNKAPLSVGDIISSWLAHDYYHMRQIILLKKDYSDYINTPYRSEYSGFEV